MRDANPGSRSASVGTKSDLSAAAAAASIRGRGSPRDQRTRAPTDSGLSPGDPGRQLCRGVGVQRTKLQGGEEGVPFVVQPTRSGSPSGEHDDLRPGRHAGQEVQQPGIPTRFVVVDDQHLA